MTDTANNDHIPEEKADEQAAPLNRAERRAALRGKKPGQVGNTVGTKNPNLPGQEGWTAGAGSKTHFHRKAGGK
ncbi:MAG: hypothetical protein WCL39_00270 [Armatimonadota bacterium]